MSRHSEFRTELTALLERYPDESSGLVNNKVLVDVLCKTIDALGQAIGLHEQLAGRLKLSDVFKPLPPDEAAATRPYLD